MAEIRLSPERYQELLNAERGLTGIVSDLDKAEACGIECQRYRETLRAQLAAIAAMKQHFAPSNANY